MLKSLPTLVSTKNLKSLLASIPPNAEIKLSANSCTVTAPDGLKILSAMKAPRRALWQVKALPGMIVEVAE